MLLHVHDELIFDVKEEEKEIISEIVKNEIKTRVSEFIQIQKYDVALDIINKAIDSYSSLDEAKWKETKAIVLFLREYHNMDKTFNYNEQIEDLYDSLTNKYKKEKKYDLYIEAIIRFLTYCSYFPGLICTKNKKFYEIFAKLTRAIEKQSPLVGLAYPAEIEIKDRFTRGFIRDFSKADLIYSIDGVRVYNKEQVDEIVAKAGTTKELKIVLKRGSIYAEDRVVKVKALLK